MNANYNAAAEDVLSKIVWTDDARIVDLLVRKRFAIESPPRAEIAVMEMP